MFRATFVLALVASSACAFTSPTLQHRASGMRTALCSKPDIPDAVTQGPQEGQIPAADNNRKGEKTMESLAKQGKKEDKKDDDKDE